MELKNNIMEALNFIQKLTIPRSEDWQAIEKKKEAVKKEENPTRLAIIYNILRETIGEIIVDEGGDKEGIPSGIKVRLFDGSIVEYPNYKAFIENYYKDVKRSIPKGEIE